MRKDDALLPGILMAATGAIAFSGKAIIVKLSYRYGVDAVTVIMFRMLFALPLFLAMGWWSGRNKPPLSRRDLVIVSLLGFLGYYLSSFLDFLGLQYITASLERLIQYLTPTLVMLIGWVLYRRRWEWRHVVGMAISYVGVLLVLGRELRVEGSNVALGSVLVFMSSSAYAIYLVLSGEVVKRLGSLRLVGYASSVACVCCIVQFLLLRPVSSALTVAPEVIWLAVLNATLGTAMPVLLVMMGVERIGPALTAQTGMVGPMATLMMGVVLLGEPFTAWVAAGTALVIVGIFVFTRSPGK